MYDYTYANLFIHSTGYELATMNNAAMNILYMTVDAYMEVFLGRTLSHLVNILFSIVVPTYIPTSSCFTFWLLLGIVRPLNFSHSDESVAIPHCGFSIGIR